MAVLIGVFGACEQIQSIYNGLVSTTGCFWGRTPALHLTIVEVYGVSDLESRKKHHRGSTMFDARVSREAILLDVSPWKVWVGLCGDYSSAGCSCCVKFATKLRKTLQKNKKGHTFVPVLWFSNLGMDSIVSLEPLRSAGRVGWTK